MSFCDKVVLLSNFIFNNINYIKKKRTSFPLESDKFIYIITAIILSSFLMKKRYYIESTNFYIYDPYCFRYSH